jgi:hypothetical protein
MEKFGDMAYNFWNKVSKSIKEVWLGKKHEEPYMTENFPTSSAYDRIYGVDAEEELNKPAAGEEIVNKRRLVLNEKTGKHEWTEGEEPVFVIKEEDKKKLEDSLKFDIDPIWVNLFEMDFLGIPKNFIQCYSQISDRQSMLRIVLGATHDYNVTHKLIELAKTTKVTRKPKTTARVKKVKKENALLNVVDASGKINYVITFYNIKVIQVNMFETFGYTTPDMASDIQYADLYFSHDKRIIQ